MARSPSLRRVPAGAQITDLNGFLAQSSNVLRNGLGWSNFAGQRFAFDFTMPSRWTPLTLAGSWVAEAGFNEPGYTVAPDGTVRLRGAVSGGAYGTTIAVLPGGARPSKFLSVPVSQACALYEPVGVVSVKPTGVIEAPVVTSVQSGTSTFLSLEGITFDAAEPAATVPGSPFPLRAILLQGATIGTVFVTGAEDTTGRRVQPAPVASVVWDVATTNGSRVFRVLDFPGLIPGHSYRVRLMALAE